MTGFFQRTQPFVMRVIVFALGPDVDEEPIMAVHGRIAEWLALDRDQPFTFFARGFRDQLLGPGAEIGDFPGRQNGDLVAALEASQPHREPKLHARIFIWRHVRPTGAHHRKRVDYEAANVDSGGRGGYQSEW